MPLKAVALLSAYVQIRTILLTLSCNSFITSLSLAGQMCFFSVTETSFACTSFCLLFMVMRERVMRVHRKTLDRRHRDALKIVVWHTSHSLASGESDSTRTMQD